MFSKRRPHEHQLKVRLLSHNPWFKDRVAKIRAELDIPENGFSSYSQADEFYFEQCIRRSKLSEIFQHYLSRLSLDERNKELDRLVSESKVGVVERQGLQVDFDALRPIQVPYSRE